MSGNYVINIGRQLGSGGKEIGEKLAARLGIDFYDKELINLASEESGLCKEFFEKADEKASQGIIGRVYMKKGCFPIVSFKYNFCIMVHLLEKSRMFAINP